MWIRSQIRFMARQPHASPLGYQSLASGDNTPNPGSQDALGVQPHHGFAPPTSSHNNNILANSTPYVLHSCTHQEVVSDRQVSQLLSTQNWTPLDWTGLYCCTQRKNGLDWTGLDCQLLSTQNWTGLPATLNTKLHLQLPCHPSN